MTAYAAQLTSSLKHLLGIMNGRFRIFTLAVNGSFDFFPTAAMGRVLPDGLEN